ncbi:DUF3304 domain-containing protein [Pseudomonas chlororaphis]|uniref:DUF3304 domain-containing protein n=1 Tax=Pseudomonas chlororaphis TaxID=587753 RepID=A0A1Q8EH34_9PSED|nr:DUF3304 domain-containing protein [Pseudomonas chlororaphis]OLF51111.1 hypothetical protein BTN82_28750 [Pseudomonas chlororaphis]
MKQGLLAVGVVLGTVGALMISACQARQEMLSAPVTGYNHTSAAINRFSVNGAGGPNLGAHEGGGSEVCCGVLPRRWHSGMKAIVEWQKDPDPYAYSEWKEKPFSDAWSGRMKEHKQGYSLHRAVVDIPKYEEKVCALQVHFLPCDQVRVSTTCYTPSHPDYPDRAYFQMKESATCPAL